MRPVPILSAALLLASAAAPALAHGGTYRSPALPPDDPGRGPGRGGTATDPGWESWWWVHQDPELERARRRAPAASGAETNGGALGRTTGGEDGNVVPDAAPDERAFLEREVLPAVTRALEDTEAEVRSAAAVALGKMGFPRSFLPLQAALRDEHPDVRDGAVLALGMVGDPFALDPLRAILFDPAREERTRGFAALALGLAGGEDAAALLASFLSPASDAARVGGLRKTDDLLCCAVIALARTGAPSAAAVLRRELSADGRPSFPVRCSAAAALGRIGDRESIPILLHALEHEDARMRQSAAVALGMLGKPGDGAVVAALARAGRGDPDAGARGCALQALGRIGGPAAVQVLRPVFREGRSTDRAQAALALGAAGDVGAGPALHRVFRESGGAWIRGALALALGMSGYRPAAEDLRAVALGKEEAALRGHAMTALALLGGPAASGDLRAVLLSDRDPWLRCTAARGLRLLGDRSAVRPLQGLATGPGTAHDRSQACYFLGILGGPDAARTLLRVLANREEEMAVRMHAVAGLGVLGDRSPVPVLASLSADTNHLLPVAPLQEVQTFL